VVRRLTEREDKHEEMEARYRAITERLEGQEFPHGTDDWTGYGPRREDLPPLPWWRIDWRFRNWRIHRRLKRRR
jgi:hypothetical protein